MNRKTILNLAALALLLGCGGVAAQIAISGLPSATTPLAGTEVVPIVQGGVTRKVAVSFIGGSAITWPTSGNLVVSNSTNTPASLAPVNGSCAIGAGGVWTTGACGGGSGTVNSGTTGQLGYYAASGTTLSGVGPGTTTTLLHGNAAGAPSYAAASLTADVTGTLPAANGGTGIASYAVGDLLYASGATALSKLADVATTNVLLSGGVATAPSWGKVANAALSNSAITLCGTSTSLGGSLTASACMDSVGATQGQILYRNGANWTVLSPGTSGQLLQSGGAAANPSWTTATGTGTVTSIAQGTGILLSTAPCTATCTISTTVLQNAQTGTSYGLQTTDGGKVVSANNGAAQAYTIAVASTSGFTAGYGFDLNCLGAGTVTLTATTSTFDNGLNAITCTKGQDIYVWSDSTNYHSVVSVPVIATNTVLGNSSGSSNYPTAQTVGTGVLTAMSNALSAAGGLTTTVASGTSAMGTGAISSGTCASVVTTAATNTATTDIIQAGFNGDPTGVTGYSPTVNGMLTIISYPSVNNVNFKVCNLTSASITPGPITLNWRVGR